MKESSLPFVVFFSSSLPSAYDYQSTLLQATYHHCIVLVCALMFCDWHMGEKKVVGIVY